LLDRPKPKRAVVPMEEEEEEEDSGMNGALDK
jgi:hypothetical protein